jgi:hypothetical protein
MSKISCVADAQVSTLIAEALEDLALPEVFIQRCKQVTLENRTRFLGFGSRTDMAQDRAELFRFYVPKRHEAGVLRRVAEAADLYLPGRGSIFAEDASVYRGDAAVFDEARLQALAAGESGPAEQHTVLCCIVQRGMAETLASTILEMGLCVPLISFGEGMGLRNRLGLLRITIPVDKEVIYFIVPERDADLLEGIAVHKARLDRPGQGFIYRYRVRARAVNLRVLRGKRSQVASMEQVIAVLDDLRGSSEWRRLSPAGRRNQRASTASGSGSLVCVSLITEEGQVGSFVAAAMEAGAGGATLVPLEHRSYSRTDDTSAASSTSGTGRNPGQASHARETCDLIIPAGILDAVLAAVDEAGLYKPGVHGVAECTQVVKAVTYTQEAGSRA